MTTDPLLALQRTVGNRATSALVKKLGLTNPGDGRLVLGALGVSPAAPRLVQRLISLDRSIVADSGLAKAILKFQELEQADLSAEEYAQLRNHRQRFMPLLGRFSVARGVDLQIGTGTKGAVGDMALTSLKGKTDNNAELDEGNPADNKAFYEAISAKTIKKFVVEVRFWDKRVRPPGADKTTLTHVGALLQAFTHEMTVHAENMLDFCEDYWAYVQGQRPAPNKLPTASQEHAVFKAGGVPRYEFMKGRATKLAQAGDVGEAFNLRESDDKRTAK